MTSRATRLHFKGNVGIGTTAPQAKLDVRGDIKLGNSGQLFATTGEENLRIVRGVVDTAENILQGSGFSVFRTGPGNYTITFNTAFANLPAVTATNMLPTEGAPPTVFAIVTVTLNSVSLRQYCNDANLCGAMDAPFHFIAIGPR